MVTKIGSKGFTGVPPPSTQKSNSSSFAEALRKSSDPAKASQELQRVIQGENRGVVEESLSIQDMEVLAQNQLAEPFRGNPAIVAKVARTLFTWAQGNPQAARFLLRGTNPSGGKLSKV